MEEDFSIFVIIYMQGNKEDGELKRASGVKVFMNLTIFIKLMLHMIIT